MPTIDFSADDSALAVSMMTEKATADLPFVSRQQSEAEFARINSENRSLVSNVMRLHGLNELGSPLDGDEDKAKEIINSVQSYKNDPTAYTDALFGAHEDPADEDKDDLVKEALPAAPAAAVATASTTMSELAMAPQIPEEPIGKIQLIPRPAETLFPGLSPTFANELIPTVRWATPKPPIPAPDPHFNFDGFSVATMATAIEERKNVMATGDPGCGKTEFFKQFGSRIGLPVTKIPMDGSLTRAEIIGSFRQIATAQGSATPFVQGSIPKLIQKPGIIILDEIDQADPDIMYMLHPVLEGEGLVIQEEGGMNIPRHPNCYIMGTANTKGRGSDNGLTHARFEMSEATRDRFPYWLNVTFMKPDLETQTVHLKTGLESSLCSKIVTVGNMIRNAYSSGELSQTCSIRQMFDVAPIAKRFSSRGDMIGLALGMETVMVGRANQEDSAAIREFIKTALNVDLNTLEL